VKGLALGFVGSLVLCLAGSAAPLCSMAPSDSAAADAHLTFAYRYYDDASTAVIDANSGRLAADYRLASDSPHFGLSVAASAEFALAGFVPAAWLGRAGGAARLYPWEGGLVFLSAGLEGAAASGPGRPGLDARIGVGLGRIADVTAAAKAVRLHRALVELGAVPRGLADDIVATVAEMIEREDEYASTRDLLADIEAVVEFGAGVPLDARAVMTMEEVVCASRKERSCGYAIALGVGYEILDPFDGIQDAVYAATADGAFVSGPDDELVVHVSFSGPFDALDENSLLGAATYTLDFGRGGTLAASYTLLRVQPAAQTARTTHEASLGLAFDLGIGSLGLQVSATRRSGEPGWSIDLSMSASLEIL